ncbi:hypothetical protein H2508_00190 [Parahaliea sp. F7430]|uniref:Uncharacterized protein n=1 Tax=Sediminihaliea albiluteola TaxID=2758564 RepID=A0A7W2TT74_9GAMM|nr:hypothetical protein [Sediminihaliea albiluteola]MBA6411537.1 hypothetical protein [Sediminihaliea albiluteola]
MLTRSIYWQRQLAALLITASGLWQIATLWLSPLGDQVLLSALLGAVYLLIGLGLFGQSRFSLFTAIVIPATVLWLVLSSDPQWTTVRYLRTAADALVVLLSTRVLWALRNQPSF